MVNMNVSFCFHFIIIIFQLQFFKQRIFLMFIVPLILLNEI